MMIFHVRQIQYNINIITRIFFGNVFGCCVSRNFYVVAVPLKRTSGTVKNLKNPDEMDMEEVGYLKTKGVMLFWRTRNV